jgi:hypothetical protein
MFDLESQIRAWRSELSSALGDRPDVIDELEGHLRDETDRRLRAGESPQQAFDAARALLGDAGGLTAEFAKLDRRRAWVPAWLAAAAVMLAVVIVACWAAARTGGGRMQPLLAWHVVAVTGGYVAALAAGGLAAWAALAHVVGRWDDHRGRDLRSATLKLACGALVLTAIGVALGAVWARDHLGRYWGWDLKEIGGAAVTAWSGLMLCAALFPPTARRQSDATAAVMLLGVAGNIVVSLSWFGPPLVMGTVRGPAPAYGPYLLAFVAVHLMLMAGHLIRSAGAPAR